MMSVANADKVTESYIVPYDSFDEYRGLLESSADVFTVIVEESLNEIPPEVLYQYFNGDAPVIDMWVIEAEGCINNILMKGEGVARTVCYMLKNQMVQAVLTSIRVTMSTWKSLDVPPIQFVHVIRKIALNIEREIKECSHG